MGSEKSGIIGTGFEGKGTRTARVAEVVYVLNEVPGYIAISKKAMGEKGKTLAEKFAETLRQMKKEGIIEKIKSKYF